HPSTGIKTFKELIAHAKANPGKLSYGSAGLGTATHMRLEMLKFKAGLDILHVPYRGSGEALNDLLANNVQMMNEVNVIPHVKAGKLTLLNINHAKRHAEFPQVPTLAEEGFSGADVPIWFGVFAPAGTPADIIATMNAKMLEIAKQPNLNTQLGAINVAILPQTPDELGRFVAQDIANNGELIKAAKIKLDG
ncbi:MAG: tripartite tricarboxylate transporter substrate-binding protein, partial [Hyphomicrobiaceae bacterium]